jgi:hypothetical protein
MEKRAWDELVASTKGHAPGPWIVRGWAPSSVHEEAWELYLSADHGRHERVNKAGNTLAAAAPILFAEVERLRGWLAEIESHVVYGGLASEQIQDALKGAEVPE